MIWSWMATASKNPRQDNIFRASSLILISFKIVHWALLTVSNVHWVLLTVSIVQWVLLTVGNVHWALLTVSNVHWVLLTVYEYCSLMWSIHFPCCYICLSFSFYKRARYSKLIIVNTVVHIESVLSIYNLIMRNMFKKQKHIKTASLPP